MALIDKCPKRPKEYMNSPSGSGQTPTQKINKKYTWQHEKGRRNWKNQTRLSVVYKRRSSFILLKKILNPHPFP